nr:helix-turn-helix domain-containing protein [Streptomyces corallincola]
MGSVQRALRLLETVAAHGHGAPAKQLARETGLALPTAYHLLRTLVHEGYLRREDGLFFLGAATERLTGGGARARENRHGTRDGTLARWRDSIGAPLYLGVYRDGEIEVEAIAASREFPAAPEVADLRATGHAHALGQCLLAQLAESGRRDHLARYPVRPLTPHTVRDEGALLRRMAGIPSAEPVFERQEYAIGTICAAIPVTVGDAPGALALSLPAHRADRLPFFARQLRAEAGHGLGSLTLSISI